MGKVCTHLLFISLLFSGCICLVLAQSGRARQSKTTKTSSPGTERSSVRNAEPTPKVNTIKDAGQPTIPLLVMLSRQRRLVMLPPSNQSYAERIAKTLGRDDQLSVRFEPQQIKLEDAQKMVREGMTTYVLLLRFEEFDDRNAQKERCPAYPEKVTSYKMDYALLAAETGGVVKKRSIQTFFSCTRNVKPFLGLFVKNCVNRSSHALDDSAVQCMAQHVLTDLYTFARRGR